MKLPKRLDKYQHNAQIEKLYKLAVDLKHEHDPLMGVDYFCEENLKVLKKINAIVIHLELAIDEIMKMENK